MEEARLSFMIIMTGFLVSWGSPRSAFTVRIGTPTLTLFRAVCP